MSGLGPEGCYLLRLFGAHITQAFDHIPYHVGSSLTAKKGERWRDVDVRLILPDDEFMAMFSGPPGYLGHDEPKRMVWNMAWSALGKQMTRLPIDFQFQPMTEANGLEENRGPRSALMLMDTDLPVTRTATSTADGGDAS